MTRPNILVVFGDQWRAQATGYAGNPDVRTPNLDRLAAASVDFRNAASGTPVCSPYRASLMTGQYPITHGVFVNDVHLEHRVPSIADVFREAGYATGYIGKWHLDGRGRSRYIPPEDRQGFEHWQVLECTHQYNDSRYYDNDDPTPRTWEGYDAIAQTDAAEAWIRTHRRENPETPFLMMLSWGPPHAPYETAPERYRALYDPEALTLRENVPGEMAAEVRPWTAGYYAHCTALDDCVGQLLALLDETGLADETILLFTSDHGDLLGSHGYMKKQQPWEESIRVPFLLRVPGLEGWTPRTLESPIDAPDILPTLCGLAGVERPGSVEGLDFSGAVRTGEEPEDAAALLSCMQPFGQWDRVRFDGREYRGLRTRRYTYAEDRSGPWLLFDNEADPFQLENLVGEPAHAALRDDLAARLHKRLDALGDAFEPGEAYLERWGYEVDEFGTVPYEN